MNAGALREAMRCTIPRIVEGEQRSSIRERRDMKKLHLLGLACVFAASAVSAQEAARAVRVVNEGGIRDAWTLAPGQKLAAPGYPAAYAQRGDNVCLAIGYRVQPNGKTSDFTTLHAWTSSAGGVEPEAGYFDAFGQAAVAALSEWQFAPKPGVSKPQPVDTVATVTFMSQKSAIDSQTLRAHCAVADLQSAIERAREKISDNKSMNHKALERRMVDQSRSDRIRNPR